MIVSLSEARLNELARSVCFCGARSVAYNIILFLFFAYIIFVTPSLLLVTAITLLRLPLLAVIISFANTDTLYCCYALLLQTSLRE